MQSTSQKWKTYIQTATGNFEYKLDISGVEYDGGAIFDLSLTGGLCGGDKLSVGNCCMRELSFTLLADGAAGIPKQARVVPYIRINGADGPTEWLQKGEFFIDRRAVGSDGARFICCDRVVMMNAPFIGSEDVDDYPMPMIGAIGMICNRAGLELDNADAIPPFSVEYPNEMTLREVAGHIASAGGGNFFVTDSGKLRLAVPRNAAPVTAASQKVYTELGGAYGIAAVSMDYGNGGFVSGEPEAGFELEIHNPWATQAMCGFVLERLGGYTHAPYSASGVFTDPSVELGDAVSLLGEDGAAEGREAVIFNADMRMGADVTCGISSPGDGAMEHEFPYQGEYARALSRKLTLGESYEGVVISRRDGIIVRYSDGSAEAQFKSGSIALRALRGNSMEDVLYFDSEKRTYVFDGELTAGVLKAFEALFTPEAYADNLYADNGAIANLTVNRLRTDWEKPFRYLRGDTSPLFYLDIRDERVMFREARTDGARSEQYTTLDGRPLYWRDTSDGLMTVTETYFPEKPDGWSGVWNPEEAKRSPVMVYMYEEISPGGFAFEEITGDWGSAQTPVLTFGRGDADGRKKGRVYKDDTALRIEYDHPDGQTYFIEIGDNGINANPPIGGHQIIGQDGPVPARPNLTFHGAEVEDDPQNDATAVRITGGAGGSGGHLILDRQPTLDDLRDLPEDGVILVYDPTSPILL